MRNCSDYWFLWEFVVFNFAFALTHCIIIFSHYFRQRIIIYNRHITNLVILKMLLFSINQLNVIHLQLTPRGHLGSLPFFRWGPCYSSSQFSVLCFLIVPSVSSNVYLLPTVCPVSCVLFDKCCQCLWFPLTFIYYLQFVLCHVSCQSVNLG